MSIREASYELFLDLRKYDEVVGTDVVQKKDNSPYIVVYLEKPIKAILDKIKSSYKGYNVKTEISSTFNSF